MIGSGKFGFHALGDYDDSLFCFEHIQILHVQETDYDKLYHAHQYYNHVFLFPVAIETIISHKPSPAHCEKYECNN